MEKVLELASLGWMLAPAQNTCCDMIALPMRPKINKIGHNQHPVTEDENEMDTDTNPQGSIYLAPRQKKKRNEYIW